MLDLNFFFFLPYTTVVNCDNALVMINSILYKNIKQIETYFDVLSST